MEMWVKIKAFILNLHTSIVYKDSNPETPRFAALVNEEQPSELNLFGKIVYWVLFPLMLVLVLYFAFKFVMKLFKRRRYKRRRRRVATRRSGSTRRRSTRAGNRKFSSMKAKMAWVRSQRKNGSKRKRKK